MRLMLGGLALAALVACDATVPDSAQGVGFGSYQDFQRRQVERETALLNSLPDRAPATAGLPAPSEVEAREIAMQTTQTLGGDTQGGAAAPTALNAAGISQENDFDNVATLRTIETDAERLAAVRAEYQVIQPTAVPTRGAAGGPNIVEFALSTSHRPGEQIYRRSGFAGSEARYQRACGQYPSADLAQEAFLRAGGPERDRMGLDPDGDGFACGWDPTPFRRVHGG